MFDKMKPFGVSEKTLWTIALGWLLLIAVGYVAATTVMVDHLKVSKAVAAQRHEARLTKGKEEAGRTVAKTSDAQAMPNAEKSEVKTGIYIDRVWEFSTSESRWGLDFYLWFNWTNPDIDPGENFQIVDGEILEKREEVRHVKDGLYYALYRIKGQITKVFNPSRFPRDDHLLTVRIEDKEFKNFELRYVPDVEGTRISSRAKFPGYKAYYSKIVDKDHAYKTRRGDPRLPENTRATYSQLIYGIGIKRQGWGLYFKMFLGIFSAVAIALIAFFVRPTDLDPRFGLGVGGFFAAVAATFVIALEIPPSNSFGLTGFVTGVSMITIFLTILTSAMSLGLYRMIKDKLWVRRFDLLSLAVFTIGWGALNTIVAIVATI